MLKRLSDPAFVNISSPSPDAVRLMKEVKREIEAPVVGEIGIGIGATTWEILQIMAGAGELHLFDFDTYLANFREEIEQEDIKTPILYHSNGRKTFESYNWNLANMLREQRRQGTAGLFDFVYLDGAHSFHHDAPAALVLKEMTKVGGIILFDDFSWSFTKSKSANPKVAEWVRNSFSQEMMDQPHIKLICELFFDYDKNFEAIDLGYRNTELRRGYRRLR